MQKTEISHMNSNSSYYLRATMHALDELIGQKLTCISLISTEPHHTCKNQITTKM